MRLRRETGDWTIKLKVNEAGDDMELLTTQLPKGLSAEDFIGAATEAGDGYKVITEAYNIPNSPYSVQIDLGSGHALFYDRRSGHLSTDSADFDPIEPDEGGDEALFTIVDETGTGIIPNTLDTGLGSEYFIGKKVKTDKDTYTITEDMFDGLGDIIKIRYTGPSLDGKPYIIYDAAEGTVTHEPKASGELPVG